MLPDSRDPYRPVLREAMEAAGHAALAHFRAAARERKADGTDVTAADLAAERVLVAALRDAFPDCGIASEEGHQHEGTDGNWYVDPIDGTSAFLDQLAHWGPTVCLVREGRLEVGALWLPRLGEFWYARRGHGAYRDDHRLVLSPRTTLEPWDSLYVPSRFHRRAPIQWPGTIRALGSSAVHLAQVAAGAGAATAIPRWSLWDVGCGVLLVEEAGGVIIDFASQPLDPVAAPGTPFLAGRRAAVEYLAAENAFPERDHART